MTVSRTQITLDQKAMLANYKRIYAAYNLQCKNSGLLNKIALQNRGGMYTTGHRLIINFCKAYHNNRTEGFRMSTSAALMAQDWGKGQAARTVRRHLIRFSETTILETEEEEGLEKMGIPLFTMMREYMKGSYKNVDLWLHPSFIVFADENIQQYHAAQYPPHSWKPPAQVPGIIGADQLRKTEQPSGEAQEVRMQMAKRLKRKFRVN